MRLGVLRGRDHTGVGRIACLAEGAVALAISRGGAAKRYSYVDPNEDAVGFATGPGGVLLAVADGHGGHEASEQVVGELLTHAAGWIGERPWSEPWEHAAGDAICRLHDGVRYRAAGGVNPESRTTLSFALVRPAEDLWAWASVGDSHIFRVSDEPTLECGPHSGKLLFLGAPTREGDDLGLRCGQEALARVRGLALVSDGISERGIGVADPPAAVTRAIEAGMRHPTELRPLETARTLAEIAVASHRDQEAGDNVACAFWLRH